MIRFSLINFLVTGFMTLFILDTSAQDLQPGQTYFSPENHVEYQFGNMPLILSASHGGELKPSNIPDRDCSGCVTTNDAFTQELIRSIAAKIEELTSCTPHVIINRLHRSKLDANRAVIEATDRNEIAEVAWNAYHSWIDSSRVSIQDEFSKGLFLDLHGHGHDFQRLELGYLLSSSNLELSDDALDTDQIYLESSIKNIAISNLQDLSFSSILRGEFSLGALLEEQEIHAVPSLEDPFPMDGEPYFSGGYNTRQYGSRDNGVIDAIQIECHQDVRFDTNKRNVFADSLARSIIRFMKVHYFEDIDQSQCFTTATTNISHESFSFYPNPATSKLHLQSSKSAFFDYKIFDLFGRLHLQQKAHQSSKAIEIESLMNGMYIIHINHSENDFQNIKFLKS